METCEVPCKPVSDSMKELNGNINSKVSSKMFMWIIGSLGAMGLMLFGLLMTGQTKMSDALVDVKISVDRQGSRIDRIEEKLVEIKEAIRK